MVAIVPRRGVKPEYQQEAFDLLRQLRAVAVMQPGYMSGETLFSIDSSGKHLIISRWRSLADWRHWESKPQRTAIVAQIERLLEGPPEIEIYQEAPPWMPEAMP